MASVEMERSVRRKNPETLIVGNNLGQEDTWIRGFWTPQEEVMVT